MDERELEAGLRALLVPYEDVLEANKLYGIEVLHRPGAKAHDWFAGVRVGTGTAKLMLLPIKSQPELLDGISPALRKRCPAMRCSRSSRATTPCSRSWRRSSRGRSMRTSAPRPMATDDRS